MSRADELAYVSATELAARIRAARPLARRGRRAVHRAHRGAQPEPQRVRVQGLRRRAGRGAGGRAGRDVRRGARRRCTACPTAMKDLFDFKPGWKARSAASARSRTSCIDALLHVRASGSRQAGAILVGKTNSPVMGLRGATDNSLFGPTRNPFDTSKQQRRLVRRQRRRRRRRPGAVRRGHGRRRLDPHPGVLVRRLRLQAVLRPRALRPAPPNAFFATQPFLYEGPITRTVDDAALALTALTGEDARDPFSLDGKVDFRGVRAARSRACASRTAPTSASSRSTRACRGGRARRRVGASGRRAPSSRRCDIAHRRTHRGAGRPLVPDDRAAQRRRRWRASRRSGIDLLRRPPRRLPARVPALDRRGLPAHARRTCCATTHALRGLRRLQQRAAHATTCWSRPTLACLPVEERRRRQHRRARARSKASRSTRSSAGA